MYFLNTSNTTNQVLVKKNNTLQHCYKLSYLPNRMNSEKIDFINKE